MAATKKGGPLQNVGLRGRLGDLGTIDPEFDVAIRYIKCFYHSSVSIFYSITIILYYYYSMYFFCLSLIEVNLNIVILTILSKPSINNIF